MTTLIQISDPHFGTERPAVMAALTELVHAESPELVVLSGDITQRARRAQFTAAARFVTGLKAPRVLAIPGNHDLPLFNPVARWWFPYANFSRAFGAELEPEFESERLLVLGVNTTRPELHKDGEISGSQRERVAKRLQGATPLQLRVVVTHQPVLAVQPKDEENVVHGHEQAVASWSEAGADVLMGGHIHLPYVRLLSEHFPALPRRLWVVQAGTAVSHRVREGAPNSINLLRYTEDGTCRVERWDYTEALRFECVETTWLALDRGARTTEVAGQNDPRQSVSSGLFPANSSERRA